MRNALLFLVVLAVLAPAQGVEMGLYSGTRTEQVLQQSDDTREVMWLMGNQGAAQWFVAPADCHVVAASFYVWNNGTKDVGVWDNDDSGSDDLPGTLLGSASYNFNYGSSWTWSDYVDLTGEGITVSSGEKFWAGITPSAGAFPALGADNTTPDYGQALHFSGYWHWYGNYDLMVRVKINDDMYGPYASGRDPSDGATGVPVESDIVFHIED
ncbi:MAG: hypothetical protein GY771_04070, partial [bacterium]|nr:hypothetical protein [bacterium]